MHSQDEVKGTIGGREEKVASSVQETQDGAKRQDDDVLDLRYKITDNEVRCMSCLVLVTGDDALQCTACGSWVCDDCIETDGDEFDESKFLCNICREISSPEPDPEPKKPRKAAVEAIVEEDKQRLAHGSSNVLPFSGDK